MNARRVSLSTFLLLLTAGAALPLLGFAVYLTMGLSLSQQEAVERGLVETNSALASAVDRELQSSVTTLEALATSRHLDRGDFGAFLDAAQRILDSQASQGWLTVHLASPGGLPLMNSAAPAGPSPALHDTQTVKQVAATAKPVISDLLAGKVRDQPAFAVRVPVVRDGAVKYVLSATVSAQSMAGALRSQQDRRDRIAVLYDGRSTIVFRTVNADRLIGTRVTPRLAEESLARESGTIDDVNLERTPVRTVFQRLRIAGWSVAVGIPQSALYAAQQRSLWNVAAVGAVFLAVAAGVSLVVGRHIRRSIVALVTSAETLNAPDDHRSVAIDTPIAEVARLDESFRAARAIIRERDAALERQVAELQVAREAADAGNRAKDAFLATLSHELRTRSTPSTDGRRCSGPGSFAACRPSGRSTRSSGTRTFRSS